MNIDIQILIIRPTFIAASEPSPVFIPYPQPVHAQQSSVEHVAPRRKLTLASLCRALLALGFWYWVITLCLRMI
jgi:hypothetical protein